MNGITRYYNQNRKMIWGIIIIIASIIIVLQIVNSLVDKQNQKKEEINNNTQSINVETNSSTIKKDKSAISGEKVESGQLKNATEIIDEFISYCNDGDVQNAYNMLTEECKENMYTSLQIFKDAYYDDNFGGQSKKAEIENWLGDTYKVRMIEDILATGKSTNGYAKQDYITVKKDGDAYKLNINNYIGYSEINKTTEQNNIKMEVLNKNTYMENEEYTIKITNNTDGTILLDNLADVDTLYIEDNNGSKYSYYGHELTEPMMTISQKQTKEVTIKFYSSYTSGKQIKDIVFSNLKLNYKSTNQNTNIITFKANV